MPFRFTGKITKLTIQPGARAVQPRRSAASGAERFNQAMLRQ